LPSGPSSFLPPNKIKIKIKIKINININININAATYTRLARSGRQSLEQRRHNEVQSER
jgi:hypothetical protein